MLLTLCIVPQSIHFPANALGDTIYMTCRSFYSAMYIESRGAFIGKYTENIKMFLNQKTHVQFLCGCRVLFR